MKNLIYTHFPCGTPKTKFSCRSYIYTSAVTHPELMEGEIKYFLECKNDPIYI